MVCCCFHVVVSYSSALHNQKPVLINAASLPRMKEKEKIRAGALVSGLVKTFWELCQRSGAKREVLWGCSARSRSQIKAKSSQLWLTAPQPKQEYPRVLPEIPPHAVALKPTSPRCVSVAPSENRGATCASGHTLQGTTGPAPSSCPSPREGIWSWPVCSALSALLSLFTKHTIHSLPAHASPAYLLVWPLLLPFFSQSQFCSQVYYFL